MIVVHLKSTGVSTDCWYKQDGSQVFTSCLLTTIILRNGYIGSAT